MKILFVAATRPNFMKVSPLLKAFVSSVDVVLVHTGQHYDSNLSSVFFSDLGIREPDYFLDVGATSSLQQIAETMSRFEKVCLQEHPSCVVVVGDVNSTLACGLVASQLHIPLAHVEAGLRSFDRTMPEEINRIVVDHLSDFLFVTEQSGIDNLRAEGITNNVFFVGNVMIDTLVDQMQKISSVAKKFDRYAVVTLHRPSNVDTPERLSLALTLLEAVSQKIPLVCPLHPRTKKNLQAFGLYERFCSCVSVLDPLGYHEFLSLVLHSSFVLTDSGGIQEETSYLGIPCITLRENTERPVTLTLGTNVLVGLDREKIFLAVAQALSSSSLRREIPFWDGHAAERICSLLLQKLKQTL